MSETVGFEPQLESFFRDYGITSLSDPAKLVARYAERFIVGGHRGSAVFTNDVTFVDWLQQLHQFNQRIGMTSMTVAGITDTRLLSDRHVLPTVEWGATFTKTGDRLITFRISYLLEKHEKSWKILAYVSEKDQDDEMRALGLL